MIYDRSAPRPLGKKRKKKSKKKFPDLTGDGKVTRADILKGRGVKLAEEEDLEEVKDVDEINPDSMEETVNEVDEEVVEEAEETSEAKHKDKKEKEVKNENWYKGNKDQLLFERLTKKWTK